MDKSNLYGNFLNPPNEFTQVPWWFWNDQITEEGIEQQLSEFRKQGIYGFTIHARMGLPRSIPYLGKRWFELVRFAVEQAHKHGMIVHLYDEGMYPSGSAHGEVVSGHPEFLARGLEMRRVEQGDLTLGEYEKSVAFLVEGQELAVPNVRPNDPVIYHFVLTPSRGTIRGVHEGEDDGELYAPKAADLLNPEAVKRFIELTHERYYKELKEFFGSTIKAIFTDEPSIMGRCSQKGLRPWTEGFEEYFRELKGYDIIPYLQALWVDGIHKRVRRDYEEAIAQRLKDSFYKQISEWCSQHNIALTGHPAESDDIGSLRYFQIPGQDVVWRYIEPNKPSMLEGKHSTVAKCSSSVARHFGARRNGNEVYGAYGWRLTMDEMKWLADWLMVRGVNLLWPHAFYYSIRDFRAYERPPDVGPHNLWWKHYHIFAKYTKRICWLLTDSTHVCNIAIISHHNHLPWEPAKALFQNQYDFNYIEDDLILKAEIVDGKINIGEESYNNLICLKGYPFSKSVEERLKEFIGQGGNIITFDPDEDVKMFLKQMRKFVKSDIKISPPNNDLRYIHVKKIYDFYFLTNEGENKIDGELEISCIGKAQLWDPLTGSSIEAEVTSVRKDAMCVQLNLERRQSIILAIDSSLPPTVSQAPKYTEDKSIDISRGWKVHKPDGEAIFMDDLRSWTQIEGYEDFSGTMAYEKNLNVTQDMMIEGHWILDLGEVHDFVEVYCNGLSCGVRLWGPFQFEIHLSPGSNNLRIEVTNSLANKYEKAMLPSGLIGPVHLRHLCCR